MLQQPWKPSGGKFSYREDLVEDQLSREIATAIRYVWEILPEGSRSLDQVDARLRAFVREESEKAASTPGLLDTDRVLIRHAVHFCARFRPEYSTSAVKLEQMVLSVLEPELQKARKDARRHGVE